MAAGGACVGDGSGAVLEHPQLDDFAVQRTIGRGSYGKALLAEHPALDRLVVLKQTDLFDMDTQHREEALKEARVLKVVCEGPDGSPHPNIIQYYGSFLEDGKLYIVMEYAEAGDLSKFIRKARQEGSHVPEDRVMSWFVQIAAALQHVHSKNILHRDLKAANIFLTGPDACHVKLGDFGIARVLGATHGSLGGGGTSANTLIGTPYYLSPEMIRGERYNDKTDVWSLGCVLYEMCTSKHAFSGPSMAAVMMAIVSRRPDPLPSDHYSPELCKLAEDMFSQDPTLRPTVADILDRPFVQRHLVRTMHILQEAAALHIRDAGVDVAAAFRDEEADEEAAAERDGVVDHGALSAGEESKAGSSRGDGSILGHTGLASHWASSASRTNTDKLEGPRQRV